MRSGRLKCYTYRHKQLWSGGGSLLVNYYTSWDATAEELNQVSKWRYANIMDIMVQSETNWIYP